MCDGHSGTGTLRTASGRQVRRPKESEVVDILSRYAHDSDDEDDSEDEDYTARSSYSESLLRGSYAASSCSSPAMLAPCCGAHYSYTRLYSLRLRFLFAV